MTMQQVEQLQRQVAELTRQNQELMLRTTPPDQRSAMQLRIEAQNQAAELAAERERLNQAALALRRRELVAELGIPADRLENLTSIEAIQQEGFKYVQENLNDPARMRQWAQVLERQQQQNGQTSQVGADGKPLTPADPTTAGAGQPAVQQQQAPGVITPPLAPGAAAAPAGAGGPSGGTGAIGPDPIDEITQRHAGKGTGDLAQWYSEISQQPASYVTLGERPSIAPSAPAPAATPAAATPQPVGAAVPS